MMEVIAINLDENIEESKFEKFKSYVSAEKLKRINRFHKYDDALRTLLGDILVRYMLTKWLNIKNHQIIFAGNIYGKPYIKNYNNIEYNISHSGKWVVGAIDSYPVGIDIEQIKTIDIKIAERFFSNEEVINLTSKCSSEREQFFYNLWTLKESYIKAVGKGLSIPLNSFTMIIEKGNISVRSLTECENYYFKQYNIDPEYKMAVCSQNNNLPKTIHNITIDELLQEFCFK